MVNKANEESSWPAQWKSAKLADACGVKQPSVWSGCIRKKGIRWKCQTHWNGYQWEASCILIRPDLSLCSPIEQSSNKANFYTERPGSSRVPAVVIRYWPHPMVHNKKTKLFTYDGKKWNKQVTANYHTARRWSALEILLINLSTLTAQSGKDDCTCRRSKDESRTDWRLLLRSCVLSDGIRHQSISRAFDMPWWTLPIKKRPVCKTERSTDQINGIFNNINGNYMQTQENNALITEKMCYVTSLSELIQQYFVPLREILNRYKTLRKSRLSTESYG